ncbi:alpha amylase C-terminal domain-containing protein, partial [Rhizobium ruizarguesonis]
HPEHGIDGVVGCRPFEALGMLRYAPDRDSSILVMSNFTPVPRYGYRIGVPSDGVWIERMTTDAREYGGSGLVNGAVSTET